VHCVLFQRILLLWLSRFGAPLDLNDISAHAYPHNLCNLPSYRHLTAHDTVMIHRCHNYQRISVMILTSISPAIRRTRKFFMLQRSCSTLEEQPILLSISFTPERSFANLASLGCITLCVQIYWTSGPFNAETTRMASFSHESIFGERSPTLVILPAPSSIQEFSDHRHIKEALKLLRSALKATAFQYHEHNHAAFLLVCPISSTLTFH
jgi:hypothetical protein